MKNQIIFNNAKIVLADRIMEGCVIVKDGTITNILHGSPGQEVEKDFDLIDCQGNYLAPGFIDTHCHGGGGADFMDGTSDAIITAARAHLKHGTTSICPTTLTCSDEELFTFFDNYHHVKETAKQMPRLLGVHLEGPYFSPEQAGAQPPEYLLNPSPAHYQTILERSHGCIARWSCAPELPGALEFADTLSQQNILVSIAHTNAIYQQVQEAVAHGFSHVTHFYSAMSSIVRKKGKRYLGVVEAAYLMDSLDVELIADGVHLPPELLRLILRCKNHNQISLCTDAMRGAGMPNGPSILGSLKNGVNVVVEDGIAYMPDHSCFAGSVATTDRLVRTMYKQADLPLWEAVRMMTLNPARMLGIQHTVGSIQVGKHADLVILDDNVKVLQVFVNGNLVA